MTTTEAADFTKSVVLKLQVDCLDELELMAAEARREWRTNAAILLEQLARQHKAKRLRKAA